MTLEEQKAYWIKHVQSLTRIENKYKPKIRKALEKHISSFISDLKQYGKDQAVNKLNVTLWNNDLLPIIQSLYAEAGLRFASKTYSEVRRDALKFSGFGFNQVWVNTILNYMRLHLLDKAVIPVSETTKKFIMDTMETAFNENWSIDQIITELEKVNYPRWKADQVARTETVKAAGVGQKVAQQSLPYETTKLWIAARDNRTRHSHRNVNGERIDGSAKFSNGLEFPGDPEGPANEVINCRCSMAVRAKRDSNGRIIPKPAQLTPTNSTQTTSIGNAIAGLL